MSGLQRRLYGMAVRMHPQAFRERFGFEMKADFEVALGDGGGRALWLDGARSLVRQWTVVAFPEAEEPVARGALLRGEYVAVSLGVPTLFGLTRAAVVVVALLMVLGWEAGRPARIVAGVGSRAMARRVSDVGRPVAQHGGPRRVAQTARHVVGRRVVGMRRLAGDVVAWGSSPSMGSPQMGRRWDAGLGLAIFLWALAILFRWRPAIGRRAALVGIGLLAMTAHGQILHATGALPAFEVATVRPWVAPPPPPAGEAVVKMVKVSPGKPGGRDGCGVVFHGDSGSTRIEDGEDEGSGGGDCD